MSPRRTLHTLATTLRLLYRINRKMTIGAAVTSVLQAALYPALLIVVSRLLRAVLDPGPSEHQAVLVGALFGLVLLQAAIAVANEGVEAILRAEFSLEVSSRVLDKLAHIPYRLFEDREFQGTYGLMISQASLRTGLLVDAAVATVVAVVGLVGVIMTLLALAPVFALVFAVALGLAAVEIAFGRRTVDLQTSSSPDLLRMEFMAQKGIDPTWQRDVRVYRSSVLEDEYRRLGTRYVGRLRQLVVRFSAWRMAAAAGSAVVVCAAVAYALHLVRGGGLTPADASVLLPGLYLGLNQARQVALHAGNLAEGLGYADQLNGFFAADFGALDREPRQLPSPSVNGAPHVVLDRVSYTYPGRPEPTLEEVTLVLRPGVTAVVGPNGAGKSTLVKLLCGLLAPQGGSISTTGLDGSGRASGLARAVLFQEPAHLQLTVRENVTMRSQRAGPADTAIWEALGQAGTRELVEALPRGLDTVLGAGFGGERDLSGGQWQRLALARLLYHESPLIVLDEPVASLDPEGERRTFELLRRLARSRIVVFTTHRYDSLTEGDSVLMIVDGHLVEHGTHGEMLGRHEGYWDLATAHRRPDGVP